MYIHLYRNNPTAGGVDGNLVSEGDGSNPITSASSVTTGNESEVITLAARCETGYTTSGNAVITPTGTTATYWSLSLDGVTWLAYGAALTIASTITAVNTLFYAKYKAAAGENPATDKTVSFNTVAKIIAA